MNSDTHSKSSMNQLPEASTEIAHRANIAAKDVMETVEDVAKDTCQTLSSEIEQGVQRSKEYARHVVDATKETASRATDVARNIYRSTASKAGDTLATSKGYVRRHPVPVVLGAIAFGAAIGYMLMMARRKQTFGERYVDEPLTAVRDAILGAIEPVAQRVHKGYDSALHGAGGSFSDKIGRIGNNLKFW